MWEFVGGVERGRKMVLFFVLKSELVKFGGKWGGVLSLVVFEKSVK